MKRRDKEKILILSATFGDGHKQVANAICEAADCTLPDAEPIIVDIMEWIHPILYPISNYVYKQSIQKFPQLYSYIFKKTRERNTLSVTLSAFLSSGMKSLLEIIEKVEPAVVVSTYPFAAGIVSQLKREGLIDLPSVTIITDYTDHSCWIHPYTDQYVVGSPLVRDRLMQHGVDGCKIKYTGIPIRQKFLQRNQSREFLVSKYGLDPHKFTLLIMGGGDGLIGKGISTFRAFDSLSSPIQMIIVCGRNKKLRRQLEEDLKDSKHDSLLLGFCENIHELMAVSDLMITKPGGVTTSEALTMGLPIFIFQPLPGQEEDNANYLLDSGLAILAESNIDLIHKLQNVIDDSRQLLMIKKRLRPYRAKNSSMEALEAILHAKNSVKEPEHAFMPYKIGQSL